jgi:hypothetical protein
MHSIFGASRKKPAHALCDSFGTVQGRQGRVVVQQGGVFVVAAGGVVGFVDDEDVGDPAGTA